MTASTLYYCSETPAPAHLGWEDFDHLVLQAVARDQDQTMWSITHRVPVGISAHLVRQSIRVLLDEGLIARTKRRIVMDPTALLLELEERVIYNVTTAGWERLYGLASEAA
jgi:predicted transcriptional regulator